MVLNEKQLIYGYDYYFKNENRPKSIVEVSEYNGYKWYKLWIYTRR